MWITGTVLLEFIFCNWFSTTESWSFFAYKSKIIWSNWRIEIWTNYNPLNEPFGLQILCNIYHQNDFDIFYSCWSLHNFFLHIAVVEPITFLLTGQTGQLLPLLFEIIIYAIRESKLCPLDINIFTPWTLKVIRNPTTRLNICLILMNDLWFYKLHRSDEVLIRQNWSTYLLCWDIELLSKWIVWCSRHEFVTENLTCSRRHMKLSCARPRVSHQNRDELQCPKNAYITRIETETESSNILLSSSMHR